MSDSSSRPPRSSSRAPTRPLLSEEEAARLQDAHLAHLAELHETGHLLAAGPYGTPAASCAASRSCVWTSSAHAR